VGIHDAAQDALEDLRDLTNPGPTAEALAGAAVLLRGPHRPTLQQGGGGSTAFGIGTGAALGVIVDVLLTLPLVGTAAGGAIGGLLGRRAKQQEAVALEALLVDDLPIGSTALVAVVPEARAGEVRAAMRRARRTTGRLLEDPTARAVARGLVRGDPIATEWLEGS
jgi:uncharacterized membrane protein